MNINAPLPEVNCHSAFRYMGAAPEEYVQCMHGWIDSFANKPNIVSFLQSEKIRELGGYLHLDSQIIDDVLETAKIVSRDSVLTAYAWHIYYRLVRGYSTSGFADWFLPVHHLKEKSPIIFLLAGLGAVQDARERYREKQIPEQIIQYTLAVIMSETINGYRQNFGYTGYPLNSLAWLRFYVDARLFQIGRFNFKLIENTPFGVVLKNKSGHKIMLAQDGLQLNSRGFCLQENDPWSDGSWTAELLITEAEYIGNPVNPAGFALWESRHFSKNDWHAVIEPGDVLIDMHIPGGGGMTPDVCRQSFAKAVSFFNGVYPGCFKPVFICHSWIFNTQFEERLPDSNLAKLMRECYLFPHGSSGRDGMYFLFGKVYDEAELPSAPRDTSVRRAMLEILESGERLRTGSMLYFADDLDSFGQSAYRNYFNLPGTG
jgi:hypothetical protein